MTDPRPIRRNPDVLTDTLAVAGKQLIDVGCGNGHLVRHLARHGAQVLGVECSPRQLAAAHAAARVADETIVEGAGQALPAADASADIVVFFNSLHHIPGEHMATALNEACRVLRADGVVYVAEPLAEGEFFALCRAVDDETQVRAARRSASQDGEHRRPCRPVSGLASFPGRAFPHQAMQWRFVRLVLPHRGKTGANRCGGSTGSRAKARQCFPVSRIVVTTGPAFGNQSGRLGRQQGGGV